MKQGYRLIKLLHKRGYKLKNYLSRNECLHLANAKRFYEAKEIFVAAGYFEMRQANNINDVVNVLEKYSPLKKSYSSGRSIVLESLLEILFWVLIASIGSCG